MKWLELEEVEPVIKKYFKYLVTEFGFKEEPSRTEPFSHVIIYSKLNLRVDIEYAYRHDYISPQIVNLDKKRYIGLEWILPKYDSNFIDYKKYNELMPRQIGLEESVKIISELFRKYAATLLSGEEWYSWDELAGYKYPDKDSSVYVKIPMEAGPAVYLKDGKKISEKEYLDNVGSDSN